MKRSILCFLVVVLANPFGRGQEVLPISPALSLLIQHADQTYARVYNESAQNFFVNNPVNAAVIMGLAMHGQKLVADRDPQFLRHYEALRREAHDFLGELARVHGHRNPSDGQPMTRESLANVFDRNASGEYNQWAVQNKLPDPALVPHPMILDRVSPESLAKLHLKEPDSVVLLGQEAPRVERDEGIDAIHRFFEAQSRQPPPPVERSAVQENDIIGVWYAHKHSLNLRGESIWTFMGDNSPGSILEFRSQGKPGHYIGLYRNLPSDPDRRIALDRIVPKEQWPGLVDLKKHRLPDGTYSICVYDGQLHGRLYEHASWGKGKIFSAGMKVMVSRDNQNRLVIDLKASPFSFPVYFREKIMD